MMSYAFVFPGQGSQSFHMLDDVYQAYPQFKLALEEASDALGYDLWQVIGDETSQQLNQTEVTQPAILAVSVGLYRCLEQPKPQVLAGHSLGEYSALTVAGSISLADAVKLVALRGRLMQSAVQEGEGSMAAIIGLSDEDVIAACQEVDEEGVVSPVNFNSPGQVVIAGQAALVEKAGALCKAKGAKRVLPLSVSVPSHCALMKPIAAEFEAALSDIAWQLPQVPVIHNVNVQAAQTIQELQESLVAQLYSPVRWTETVLRFEQQGFSQLYEVGPGKVLTGLTKRIHKEVSATALSSAEAVQLFNQKG